MKFKNERVRVVVEIVAVTALAVLGAWIFAGCVAVAGPPKEDGSPPDTSWALGVPAWMGALLATLWSWITGAPAPTPDFWTRAHDAIVGHVPEIAAAGTLLFPRVRENAGGFFGALANAVTNGNAAGRLANLKDAGLHVAAIPGLAHTPELPAPAKAS